MARSKKTKSNGNGANLAQGQSLFARPRKQTGTVLFVPLIVLGLIFLKWIDDKIELNRRTNETPESMARALFKSWFIDCDPVHARAADLIADGILEIGDGYRAKNSELDLGGLPFVRAGNLNTGFDLINAERLCMSSVARAGSKVSRPGDVAFTSKGTVGRIARVNANTAPFVYAPQICYWRSLDALRLHPAILYCWMSSVDFSEQIQSFSGQTDMAPYISLRDQRQLRVPRFPPSQTAMGNQIEIILKRIACGSHESHSLAATRDALLPKLLAGDMLA